MFSFPVTPAPPEDSVTTISLPSEPFLPFFHLKKPGPLVVMSSLKMVVPMGDSTFRLPLVGSAV
jgi:hypothetical protein